MPKVKKQILIVDDSSLARSMLKKLVNSTDFCEVIGEASSGEDALDTYKRLRPDLVTMDIIMPGKNGLETIKDILKFDNSALIIIISALNEETIGKNKPKEIKAFIPKPFKDEEVIRILKKILLSNN